MEHNTSRLRHIAALIATVLAALVFALPAQGAERAKPPQSVRLYVFDCGTLHLASTLPFSLQSTEVTTGDLSLACFLVAHPKGTLFWDAGGVPDSDWKATGAPVKHRIVLPGAGERDVTMTKPLVPQLAEAGYSPADITYLALSHYHWDHTGNANSFAGATWLVRQVERDAMFTVKPPFGSQPSTYAALRNSKALIIKDDHDVFGDGRVVIKSTPGHTPGHQSLYVKLARTGGVVLSGDLYHFPESRALQRVPTFDVDQERSHLTRMGVEAFLRVSGTQLWIQHDYGANARLRKAPAYYD
jgi:N-acyl homoserine lactone hydrolase